MIAVNDTTISSVKVNGTTVSAVLAKDAKKGYESVVFPKGTQIRLDVVGQPFPDTRIYRTYLPYYYITEEGQYLIPSVNRTNVHVQIISNSREVYFGTVREGMHLRMTTVGNTVTVEEI